jgi:APA family basic amino acid/polyamine antiporter
VLVPTISESQELIRIGKFVLSPTRLLAIGVVVLLTWSNSTGLRTGKLVQNIFTVTKIAALLGLVALGLTVGANSNAIHTNFQNAWSTSFTSATGPAGTGSTSTPLSSWALLLVLGTAMVGSLFSADSWNNVTFTAGEVKNPKRNLPLSLFLGVTLVCLLYFLANVGYLLTLPWPARLRAPT